QLSAFLLNGGLIHAITKHVFLQESVETGLYWRSEAAKRGHVIAQRLMAERFRSLDDKANALLWYEYAAKQGDTVSKKYMISFPSLSQQKITLDANGKCVQ